jgi:hypothetical protein
MVAKNWRGLGYVECNGVFHIRRVGGGCGIDAFQAISGLRALYLWGQQCLQPDLVFFFELVCRALGRHSQLHATQFYFAHA